MPDHRTITSSGVHEPKHITDTTSADAGKVITPLSNGTSELRFLTPAEVGINFAYGELALNANTTSFAIPIAVDTALYTESDYVQLNSVRAPGIFLDQAVGVSFDGTINALIPSISGDYRLSFWMNVQSNTANTKLGVKVNKGSSWANFTTKTDIKDLGRVQNISGSVITSLTASDQVSLFLASDKNANIVVQDLHFYIELLREV